MGRLENRIPRAGDMVLDVLVRLGWRRRIVLAGHNQRRRLDLRQQVAVIHVAHRLATGEIAVEGRRGEHLAQPGDLLRRALPEFAVELALPAWAGEDGDTFF